MSNLTTQQKRYFTGENAYHEIISKLVDYPTAQQLAKEVYGFYDEYLSYTEGKNFKSSHFSIDLQNEPTIALKSATIQLKLGTNRIAEALVHELLHLQLPKLGFPLAHKVGIPNNLDRFAKTFLEMYPKIVNIVQHEITLESFIALGFEKKNFLGKLTKPINYHQKMLNPSPNEVYFPITGFPWFCLEYLRHWITTRHSNNKNELRFANDVREWGSKLEPDFRQTTSEIIKWVENGAFKNPNKYPRQINMLFQLMKIPQIDEWVVLNHPKKED